jgi:2-oxo-3-hexenedioate decarboxylase
MTPREILQHDDTGQQWPASDSNALADLPSAYGVALEVRRLRVARGESPCGYKVGFTNRTIWSRYNVFAPIWGSVWNTTVTHCDGTGSISLRHLSQPRIEPEAVFGFKAPPPPNAGVDELFRALDWIAPGFEIVQSHLPDWKFIASQTVVDAGLHGRLLIGPKIPIATLAGDGKQLHRSLAAARVRLSKDGVVVEEGAGANVLDSPLMALLHFLNELRSCVDAPDVAAGDVVTTGTWTDAWRVSPGQAWRAEFDAVLPALEIRLQ